MLALKPEYAGDRVFAFGVGLASMVFLSYNEKTEFYLTEQLRSAEALQLGAEHRDRRRGNSPTPVTREVTPLLLSNEIAGDARNLSFEREFGKMIAYQDVMARDRRPADEPDRSGGWSQTLATAVFLPI